MSSRSNAAQAGMTGEQRRMMFRLAKEQEMDIDTLRARAEAVTGSEHLSQLTKLQAARVIDSLMGKQPMYGRRERAVTRITQGQVDVIFGLARKMGWLDEGYDRIKGFVRSRYGVEVIDWMTPEQGRQCIEALKAMAAGGRAERKGTRRKES